ncbi:MAG: hypothetical protein LBJ10_06180 [Clostridiales bacterium]|nr:hypothetical protein [Clostridiales bacterium]
MNNEFRSIFEHAQPERRERRHGHAPRRKAAVWLAAAAWAALPVGLYLLGIAQPQSRTFFDIVYDKSVRAAAIPELIVAAALVWAGGAGFGLAALLLARGMFRRKSDKLHVSALCALIACAVAAIAAFLYIIASQGLQI